MTDAIITKSVIEDLPTLNEIRVASKMYWGYPKEWLEHWKDAFAIKSEDFEKHLIYKLQLDNQIIGFCVIAEETDHYEVLHLWVLPDFIRKGYGKLLLHTSLERSIAKPMDILVKADPNAEAFYASQGFITFDQVDSFPERHFLPVMRKRKKISKV